MPSREGALRADAARPAQAGQATSRSAQAGLVVSRPAQTGQATVEFALVVPLVVVLMLCSVQVALVARDAVLLSHASGVAARAASVETVDIASAVRAETALDADRLRVTSRADGEFTEVELTYRSPTAVPLVGLMVGDVTLTERLWTKPAWQMSTQCC